MIMSNIVAGFHTTGVYPRDPSAVPTCTGLDHATCREVRAAV